MRSFRRIEGEALPLCHLSGLTKFFSESGRMRSFRRIESEALPLCHLSKHI